MVDFFQTRAGRTFTEGTIPNLTRAIEKLGRELERFNQTVNSIDIIEKMVDKKIDEVLDRRMLIPQDVPKGGDDK